MSSPTINPPGGRIAIVADGDSYFSNFASLDFFASFLCREKNEEPVLFEDKHDHLSN